VENVTEISGVVVVVVNGILHGPNDHVDDILGEGYGRRIWAGTFPFVTVVNASHPNGHLKENGGVLYLHRLV
jgi:hypothetical protein